MVLALELLAVEVAASPQVSLVAACVLGKRNCVNLRSIRQAPVVSFLARATSESDYATADTELLDLPLVVLVVAVFVWDRPPVLTLSAAHHPTFPERFS